jgi:hypothetical protein
VDTLIDQSVRIKTIEKFMSQVCQTSTYGGYTVLSSTMNFFKNLLNPRERKPVVPFFTSEEITKFNALGVTQEDLAIIEAHHSLARDVIRETMILLFEKSNKTIAGWRMRDIILSITEDDVVSAQFLNQSEVEHIKSNKISCVDTNWILQERNIDGLETLVKSSNLTVRAAFDFYDSLSHKDKLAITKISFDARIFIQDNFEQLADAGLSLDKEFAEINRVFAGLPSQHNRLQEADLPEGLTLKFIKIFLSEQMKTFVLSSALRRNLDIAERKFTPTVSAQPPSIAQSILGDFTMWINCKIDNRCPQQIPAPLTELLDPLPHPETLSKTLAQAIVGTGNVTLTNAAQVIDTIDRKDNQIFDFSDIEITDELFTAEFKSELLNEVTYYLVYIQVQNTVVDFNKNVLFSPLDIGRQLTNAFHTALSCYFVKQLSPMISQACESTWKVLDSFAVTATEVATEIQRLPEPPTATASAASNTFSSWQLLGIGCAITTSAYLLFNHFKRKPSVQMLSATSEKKRMLTP